MTSVTATGTSRRPSCCGAAKEAREAAMGCEGRKWLCSTQCPLISSGATALLSASHSWQAQGTLANCVGFAAGGGGMKMGLQRLCSRFCCQLSPEGGWPCLAERSGYAPAGQSSEFWPLFSRSIDSLWTTALNLALICVCLKQRQNHKKQTSWICTETIEQCSPSNSKIMC